jgi:type IV pilus assembly protein PilV
MLKKMGQNNKGFSLIEVLMALGIFSIGMIAIGTMMGIAINGNKRNHAYTEALYLAENKMDELIISPYTTINANVENTLDSHGVQGTGIYKRVVQVNESMDPTYKIIEVIVSWRHARTRQVTLKTMVAQ